MHQQKTTKLMLTLLTSTTFLWVASIIIIILMAILLEFQREGWATTFFSLGIALIIWNFKTDIWYFVSSNPLSTLGFILSYIVIGVVWSFLKWSSYVKSVFDKFKKLKIKFEKQNGTIDDKNRGDFNRILNSNFSTYFANKDDFDENIKTITPVASDKKSVITSWISYWPISFVATLLNDPFRKFFQWIYDCLSGFYDKITNRHKNEALGK